MLFLLSFKVFWRELKSDQLSVMFVALLLAVTSVSCISIFTDRLQKALLLETQEFLGGDLKYFCKIRSNLFCFDDFSG